MNGGILSTRYAKAIYEFAVEKHTDEELYKDMQLLIASFSSLPAMRRVINDPTLSGDNIIDLLTTACGQQVGDTARQVVRMVVENGRAGNMEMIAYSYVDIYRREKGILQVQLTTVEPVGEATRRELSKLLALASDQTVEFRSRTDKDLIGGFILELGDQRLNASVKNQLAQLKLDLME